MKKGDIVEVRDLSINEWQQRIFLAEIQSIRFPFMCVQAGDEELFRKGEKVNYVCWNEMRPYNAFELLCADGVTVTDPEQVVYWLYENVIFDGKAKNNHGEGVFSTKAAAEKHLMKTARVLCLDDLEERIDSASFWASLIELVDQRLK